jgi:nucleotide-binding universal stress UspA family protein
MSSAHPPALILLPVEQSELAVQSLRSVSKLSKCWELEVTLLHVWEPLPFTPPETPFYDEGQLTTYRNAAAERGLAVLARVAADAKELGVKVSSTIVRSGDPAEVILTVANELGAGWIVMSSHQRKGLSRWFLGSVAERVAAGAACPVLTVPVRE